MKLYSIDVPVFATAYIKAESPEEALEKCRYQLLQSFLEASGPDFDDRNYAAIMDDEHAEVTLSPAMTVGDAVCDDIIGLAFDPEDDEAAA